jgi:hypothetical protein
MTDCAAGSKIVVPATNPWRLCGKNASLARVGAAVVGVSWCCLPAGKSLIYKRSSSVHQGGRGQLHDGQLLVKSAHENAQRHRQLSVTVGDDR